MHPMYFMSIATFVCIVPITAFFGFLIAVTRHKDKGIVCSCTDDGFPLGISDNPMQGWNLRSWARPDVLAALHSENVRDGNDQ